MEEQAALRLLLLLFAVSCSASAQDGVNYVQVGGSLVLTPPTVDAINNILWKHNRNLVAERIKGTGELIVYGLFKGRTSLDRTTGRLEIQNANVSDSGVYSVEINDHVFKEEQQRVNVIQQVPTPRVRVTPLTCAAASVGCNMTCQGETGPAEPVTFHWKEEGNDWERSTRSRAFTAADTKYVKSFMCRMENPVSKKDSEPEPNPLYSDDESDLTGLWALLVIPLAGVVGVVGYLKRDSIRTWMSTRKGEHNVTSNEPPAENTVPLKEGDKSNTQP